MKDVESLNFEVAKLDLSWKIFQLYFLSLDRIAIAMFLFCPTIMFGPCPSSPLHEPTVHVHVSRSLLFL